MQFRRKASIAKKIDLKIACHFYSQTNTLQGTWGTLFLLRFEKDVPTNISETIGRREKSVIQKL